MSIFSDKSNRAHTQVWLLDLYLNIIIFIILFNFSTESGKAFEIMVGNQTVQPELDDHCVIDMLNGACQPGKFFLKVNI